jgi:hypothetical protein
MSTVPCAVDHMDLRWLFVAGLYSLSALWGVVQSLSTNSALYMLSSLMFALLATGWCVVDARRRNRPLLSVVQMIMFLTWPLAVPICLMRLAGGAALVTLCFTASA